MLTRPIDIVAHLFGGTLSLKTIGSPFPGDSLGDGVPSVKLRARVPLSISPIPGLLSRDHGLPDGGGRNCPRDDPPPPNPFAFIGEPPTIAMLATERAAH